VVAGGTYEELERSDDAWVGAFFAWHADRTGAPAAAQTKDRTR